MGITITALLFALFLPLTQSACTCGTNTNQTWSLSFQSIYVLNPTDNVTNAPCAMNCTYYLTYAGSDSSTRSISGYFITWMAASDFAERLIFYDGIGTTGIILYNTSENSTRDPIVAYSPTMTVTLTTTTTPANPATFKLSFTIVQRAILTTTTVPTTTTPYPGPYTCNPATVQLDIAVLLDLSGLVDPPVFNTMKSFVATELLSQLDIQPNNSVKAQVTGAYVSPGGFVQNISPGWSLNATQMTTFFQGVFETGIQDYSNYASILGGLRDYPFNKSVPYGQLLRENVPTLLYIISGSGVKDIDAAIAIATQIKQMGVRIMTVQVGPLSPNNINLLASPGLSVSFGDGNDLTVNGKNIFYNNTACNGNNLCGGCGTAMTSIDTTGTPFSLVQSPSKRYCNRMVCTWTFRATAGYNASVTFSWIDIEFERDYIEVFDGNMNGLALFSGYNTKNATVIAGTQAITFTFTSNPTNVYAGFQGIAMAVQSSSKVELLEEFIPNP